jgi:hypothetical protein
MVVVAAPAAVGASGVLVGPASAVIVRVTAAARRRVGRDMDEVAPRVSSVGWAPGRLPPVSIGTSGRFCIEQMSHVAVTAVT